MKTHHLFCNKASQSFGRTSAGIEWCLGGCILKMTFTIGKDFAVYKIENRVRMLYWKKNSNFFIVKFYAYIFIVKMNAINVYHLKIKCKLTKRFD